MTDIDRPEFCMCPEPWQTKHGPLKDGTHYVECVAEEVAEALRAERETVNRLETDIHGCACPAPYDACTHDEPFMAIVNRLEAENETARGVIRRLLDGWEPQQDRWQEETDHEPMSDAEQALLASIEEEDDGR